ncbi:DUF4303 domain-containing protein [Rhodopirellula sp. MGV]|uniref:DUF4303 domain-containing protein n=1 Tax=Rhodopirellula sp. MGV TaxID=2023130 RepID=UPI000B960B10|nr:DUF4303 domain-containing protein [Rhodopirellula sp. MGV]OYP38910.1 hypothetical protein CGZ80_01440 [Rhodopirellula sp. MGV]PNY38276.1 DUF4303 domain-containing protein [Rhodopirellula baltica]
MLRENPNDSFYYCSLITTGEGHTPYLTAWSREKLKEAVDAEGGGDDLIAELKWSCADSPFCFYGESYFEPVKQIFIGRSELNDRDSTSDASELELRLKAMELAMAELDEEGLFGSGNERLKIVINAEVMPPDHSNVERALRLNPEQALSDWMNEAAEQ